MLSKFLQYSKDYHKMILILTILMLLFIFFEKNFQFKPIRIHIPYYFSCVFTFEVLNKIAHIFFGGLVFLFFYLSIGFLSRNLNNIYLKTGLHVISIVLAFVSSYMLDTYLMTPCTDSGCAYKGIMDILFNTIGLIIMVSFTCQKGTKNI